MSWTRLSRKGPVAVAPMNVEVTDRMLQTRGIAKIPMFVIWSVLAFGLIIAVGVAIGFHSGYKQGFNEGLTINYLEDQERKTE